MTDSKDILINKTVQAEKVMHGKNILNMQNKTFEHHLEQNSENNQIITYEEWKTEERKQENKD